MQNSMKTMMERFFKNRIRRRRLAAAFVALSLLVVTSVSLELMRPVATMTPDLVCEKAEHTHDSSCYESLLTCALQEGEEHTHSAACYSKVLTCAKAEHAHSSVCYVAEAEPVMNREAAAESTDAPQHTDAPENTAETENTAAPEKTEAPENTESPENTQAPEDTEAPQATSTPEATQEPVKLSLSALTGSTQVTIGETASWTFQAAGAESVSYAIADASGANVAGGTLSNDAHHQISYLATAAGSYTLTVTAKAGDAVETASAAFTVQEAEKLTVSALCAVRSCFAGDTVEFNLAMGGGVQPVQCKITVDQSGTVLAEYDAFAETIRAATREVKSVTDVTLTVTLTDAAGATASQSVSIPCAVHDRETASQWEKSARVDLAGVWAEDLLAVAKTQLGYRESDIDFVIREDGSKQGYTRYGDWAGMDYEEWCAMFVSFCLNYADIPEYQFARSSGCDKWIRALKSDGLWQSAKEAPVPGDLIFFDWDGDNASDHVGIVSKVSDDTVYTIEGNSGAMVRNREYRLNDGTIMGYGTLTVAYERCHAVKTTVAPADAVGMTGIVSVESANLRAAATTDSEVSAKLERGDAVEIQSVEQSDEETWYEVTAGEAEGYLRSDLVTIAAQEEILEPAASEAVEVLRAEIEALYAREDATEEDAAALEAELTAARDSGKITEEDYQALIALLYSAAATLEETGEDITITFEIANPEYTSDVCSEYSSDTNTTYSHVQVETLEGLITDGGLTYEILGTGKAYWVYGTGALARITIPAGTSLKANNAAIPEVSPSNRVGNGGVNLSKKSYVSAYSWMNGDTVCTDTTMFYADTTLKLRLYENNDLWTLNFVCCDTMKSVLVTGKSVNFTKGMKISAAYIPTAEDMNALEFTSAHSHAEQVFDHWYLVDATTKSQVELTEDVSLSENYAYANGTRTIVVYAAWTDGPDRATVTFMWDDEVYDRSKVEVGTGLNSLPEAPVREGFVFEGWKDEDGNWYSEGQTFNEDTVFYAQFRELCHVNYEIRTWSPSKFTKHYESTDLLSSQQINLDSNMTNALWRDESGNTYTHGALMALTGDEANGHTYTLDYTLVWSNVQFTVQTGASVYEIQYIAVPSVTEGQTLAEVFASNATLFDGKLNGYTDYSGEKYVIAGWKYTNASEEEVTIDENTPVSVAMEKGGAMTFTAVYATEASLQTVEVTFEYNSQNYTYTVAKGVTFAQALAAAQADETNPLPVPEETVNGDDGVFRFRGWGYRRPTAVLDSELVVVADDDTITGNITFIAIYEKIEMYTVAFHLIGVDGSEVGADVSVDVLVPGGESVKDYLSGAELADGTNCANVPVWRTRNSDGTTQVYDVDQAVTGDLELYVYTYQIVLTIAQDTSAQTASNAILDYLFPKAYAEINVAVQGNTLTITGLEGDIIRPSDFVINGVDYTLYTFTVDGNSVSVSSLIGQSLNGDLTYTIVRPANTKDCEVIFYVSINGQWQDVASYEKMPLVLIDGRRYVTVNQLAAVYARFGFDPAGVTINSKTTIGHIQGASAKNDIYYGLAVKQVGDTLCVPVINTSTTSCGIYYLPKATVPTQEVHYGRDSLASSNTFYTLEVQDSGVVYSASQAEALTKYVLTGKSGEITVSNACKVAGLEGAQVNWKVYNANGSEVSNTAYTSVSDGNNTTTFKFVDISEQYILKPTVVLPEGVYSLTYHINLPSNVTIASTRPQIGDGDTYTVYIQQSEDGTYTILSPTLTEFNYNSNKNSLYSYLFKGWMLEESGKNVVYTAEQEALISDLIAKDTNGDQTIDLYGLWSDQSKNYSVTFYINMAGQLMTYTTSGYAGGDIIGNAGWCDSVYGTSVSIVEAPTSWPYQGQTGASLSGGNVVIYDVTNTGHSNTNSGKNADSVIRNDLTSSNGVEAYYSGADRTFRIGSVPSDEAALARARSLQATYITSYLSATNNGATQTAMEWAKTVTGRDQNNNPIYGNKILYNSETGAYIPVEDITSDNYTIRWYAFKMEDNGWHVDGALIPKQAKLVVTKTFYGDESMISAVRDGYTVQVTGTAYNKTLKLGEATSSVGNTYTWVLDDVSQGVTYTVKESGYYTEQDQKTTSAEYRVVNPSKKTQVSPGWNQYTEDGVSVVASAYSDDDSNYQTVQLLNSYVPAKSMLIRKRDDTGAPLSGVEFTLSKDNEVTKLYKDTAGKYHIETVEGATPVNVLTTDSDGVIWLVWPETDTYAGTYTLAETKTPEGYTSVEPFTFSVDASGAVVLGNLPANDAGLVSLNNGVLSVTNRSDVSQVTVKKVWDANVTNREAVTLTLQQNGVSMTGATVNGTPYTITLDGSTADSHEAIPWQVTWEGLPIYSGGELIRYTVREDSISSTHYDANADSDGYEDWTVSQTTTVDENHVQIVVTNALALNGVSFKKVDEELNPLPNAVFTLYTNEGCTAVYGTATSGTDGNVVFTNVLPGTYYMKETQVPEGYQENETVYKVSVTGRSFTIVDNASTGDVENLTQIQNQKVQKVSITVKKVDQDSNPLNGATFELKKENGTDTYVKVENAGFNNSGDTWTLTDLEAGNYRIVETAAPAGYYKLADTIDFSIAADGTVSLPDSEGKWTYDSNTFILTVTNCAGRALPHTGGVGTVPYTMGGLLILAVGLLYGLGLRRKRERRVRG